MGADWWKPRKNVFARITRYKHENFCACRMAFTGILNKIVQNSGFRIKNIGKTSYGQRK